METAGRWLRSAPAEWLGLAARVVVGGVWIWAGVAKLADPYGSAQAVRAYQILPWRVADAVGHTLPSLEVVIGTALVLGLLTRGAAAVSVLMFVAFIIGISSVWARGIQIDCGCFGGGGYDPNATGHYPWELARDTGLLLLSFFVVVVGRTQLAADDLLFRRTTKGA